MALSVRGLSMVDIRPIQTPPSSVCVYFLVLLYSVRLYLIWNTIPGLRKVTNSLKNALYPCLSLIYGEINKYCLFPPVDFPAGDLNPSDVVGPRSTSRVNLLA